MTALQGLLTLFVLGLFALIVVALIGILFCIGDGDYKKAAVFGVFASVLAIIVIALILLAF